MGESPSTKKILLGQYEVTGEIGEGAQAFVYAVSDLRNGIPKVAKVLKAPGASPAPGADKVKGHIREFQILDSLDHPNLVRVYDVRKDPAQDTWVMVCEMVEKARDLKMVLRESLSLQQRIQIAFQILSAVAYLHRKQVIHGDLKPQNILVQFEGEAKTPHVKIIDFGVSRDLTIERVAKRAGTPFYMAPEVLREMGITRASDVYSVGVILYQLFVNPVLPYKHLPHSEFWQLLSQGKEFFPETFVREQAEQLHLQQAVPPLILKFIIRALQIEPAQRARHLLDEATVWQQTFASELAGFALPILDSRLRNSLGLSGLIAKAEKFIVEHLQGLGGPSMFVAYGPSGQGKSRFMHEVIRFAQGKQWNWTFVAFRSKDFWPIVCRDLMFHYPDSKAVKKHRASLHVFFENQNVLPEWAEFYEDSFAIFLIDLAEEIGPMVFCIDGFHARLAQSTVGVLEKILKRLGQQQVPLVLVATSDVSYLTPDALLAQKHQQRQNQLQQINVDDEKSLPAHALSALIDEMKRQNGESSAPVHVKLPSQMESLAFRKMVHAEALMPWNAKEVELFLNDIFDRYLQAGEHFSAQTITLLLEKTQGNPGHLQSLCEGVSEKIYRKEIARGKINLATIEKWLCIKDLDSKIFDSQVYRLKRLVHDQAVIESQLRERFMTLLPEHRSFWQKTCIQQVPHHLWRFLGLAAALPVFSLDDLYFLLKKTFDDCGTPAPTPNIFQECATILTSYFVDRLSDEKLLAIKPNGKLFFMDNPNVTAFLKEEINRGPGKQLMLALKKLAPPHHAIFIARLLNDTQFAGDFFSNLVTEVVDPSTYLPLEPLLNSFLEDMALSDSGVNQKTRLLMQFFSLEFALLHHHLQRAQSLARGILGQELDPELRSDRQMQHLMLQTRFRLATVLRRLGQYALAYDDYCLTLLDAGLDSGQRLDAQGHALLCQVLSGQAKISDVEKDLAKVHQELRVENPVRGGVLSTSIAGFLMQQGRYADSIVHFNEALAVFRAHQQTSRQTHVLSRLGKAYFLMQDYPNAKSIFAEMVQQAEQGEYNEMMQDGLLYLIRMAHAECEFERMFKLIADLKSFCEQKNDHAPLDAIIELRALSLMQLGRVDEGQDILQSRLRELRNDPRGHVLLKISIEQMRIPLYLRQGLVEQAKMVLERVSMAIDHAASTHGDLAVYRAFLELRRAEIALCEEGPLAYHRILTHLKTRGLPPDFVLDFELRKFHGAVTGGMREVNAEFLDAATIEKLDPFGRFQFFCDQAYLAQAKNQIQRAREFLEIATPLKAKICDIWLRFYYHAIGSLIFTQELKGQEFRAAVLADRQEILKGVEKRIRADFSKRFYLFQMLPQSLGLNLGTQSTGFATDLAQGVHDLYPTDAGQNPADLTPEARKK